MANKSPNNPNKFVFPSGDAPSSITNIVGFSSNDKSSITKFVVKPNQQLTTLYNKQNFGCHVI
jgi:hypothetical protein